MKKAGKIMLAADLILGSLLLFTCAWKNAGGRAEADMVRTARTAEWTNAQILAADAEALPARGDRAEKRMVALTFDEDVIIGLRRGHC